jgi:hypothetical protein
MRERAYLVAAAATIVSLLGATPAVAQDPAGCVGNTFQLDITKDRTYIRDGETINYTVAISNNIPGSCTVSQISVLLNLPAATGEPSPAFQQLTNNATFGIPTPRLQFGPFPYTVAFGANPPDRYTSQVSVTDGRLRDIPPPYSRLDILRTLQTLTVQPALTIDKVGSTTGGPAPQTVTYTYTVRNTTKVAIAPPAPAEPGVDMSNVAPTDDRCGPLTYVSGDTNGDGQLQRIETWTYTCTSNFPNPGSFTNTATVCADQVLDRIPKHVCSPPDTWTVTVTPPPQVAVRPAAAQQCTLSTPRGLNVRARERTTIRVQTRLVDAGTRVTIRLPGGRTVSARTNSRGLAVLRVTPPRSGRARIRVAECSAVERLTVRKARQVVSRRIPRVTG